VSRTRRDMHKKLVKDRKRQQKNRRILKGTAFEFVAFRQEMSGEEIYRRWGDARKLYREIKEGKRKQYIGTSTDLGKLSLKEKQRYFQVLGAVIDECNQPNPRRLLK